MSTDLLSLKLTSELANTTASPQVVPLSVKDREALAQAYLTAYPPGVAASDLAAALDEIDQSFAGEYGLLRLDASASVIHHGKVAGAVLVVERSIWDDWLSGPFIIDFFVAAHAQGNGAGRHLLEHTIRACAAAGDNQLSLRTGEGTSPAAAHLYEALGFSPPSAD